MSLLSAQRVSTTESDRILPSEPTSDKLQARLPCHPDDSHVSLAQSSHAVYYGERLSMSTERALLSCDTVIYLPLHYVSIFNT